MNDIPGFATYRRTSIAALAAVSLCLPGLLPVSHAYALDLGSPVGKTPYDQYLGPLWTVMGHLGGNQPDPAVVAKLVSEGRGFRYVFKKDQPYVPQTPEETESTHSGDCKAKALWLASKMDCRKVRFVIGKAKQGDSQSHAWLIWEAPDGWLILDATLYSRPMDPDKTSPSEWVPSYSYAPGGKYAHAMAAGAAQKRYGDHM